MYKVIRSALIMRLCARLAPAVKEPEQLLSITFLPVILTWPEEYGVFDERVEAHEAIHIYQQLECAIVGVFAAVAIAGLFQLPGWAFTVLFVGCFLPPTNPFYAVYLLTWLYWRREARTPPDEVRFLHLVPPSVQAYFLIPFEREAFLYEDLGLEYLNRRRMFAWLRIAEQEDAVDGAKMPEKLYSYYKDHHFFGVLNVRE